MLAINPQMAWIWRHIASLQEAFTPEYLRNTQQIPQEVFFFIYIRHSIYRIHSSTSLRRCFSHLCSATKVLSSPRRLLQSDRCSRKHMGIRPDTSPGITIDTRSYSVRNVLWLETSN